MDNIAWVFPGGKRVNKAIPATAGNVVRNMSPGSGKRWLIFRGIITFVADATVANRYIILETTDGTTVTNKLGRYTTAVTASQTRKKDFGEVRIANAADFGNAAGYIGHNPIILEGSDQLRITITDGQAGDSYSGYLVILEIDTP